MNCKRMEQWVLLAASGELSAGRARKLDAHLSVCHGCRQYRESAAALSAQAADGFCTAQPDALVMARIRAEAARRVADHRVILFRRPAIQVLAYAACLAIILGVWRHVAVDEPAKRVDGARAIVALVSDSVLEQSELHAAQEEDEALQALAADLLLMEGLSVDETAGLDALWDAPTEGGEPSPTGLRDRSTGGLPAKEYV